MTHIQTHSEGPRSLREEVLPGQIGPSTVNAAGAGHLRHCVTSFCRLAPRLRIGFRAMYSYRLVGRPMGSRPQWPVADFLFLSYSGPFLCLAMYSYWSSISTRHDGTRRQPRSHAYLQSDVISPKGMRHCIDDRTCKCPCGSQEPQQKQVKDPSAESFWKKWPEQHEALEKRGQVALSATGSAPTFPKRSIVSKLRRLSMHVLT